MTIKKVRASGYNSVTQKNIEKWTQEYKSGNITENDYNQTIATELKAIAAELETVQKRLEYILYGRY